MGGCLTGSRAGIDLPFNKEENCPKDYDRLCKVLIVGDQAVGKTMLAHRLVENKFERVASTVGIDLRVKYINTGGQKIKMQLWDSAGQERFRTNTTAFYRNANIIILCYDTTDQFFDVGVRRWVAEITKYASKSVIMVMAGTKRDLEESRKVTAEAAETVRQLVGAEFIMETSSKTNMNVDNLFVKAAEKWHAKLIASEQQKTQPDSQKKR